MSWSIHSSPPAPEPSELARSSRRLPLRHARRRLRCSAKRVATIEQRNTFTFPNSSSPLVLLLPKLTDRGRGNARFREMHRRGERECGGPRSIGRSNQGDKVEIEQTTSSRTLEIGRTGTRRTGETRMRRCSVEFS
jgi:hypothetical protein